MATLTKSLLPISGYTNQYYTYQCVVTENSYSIANNTSNVTITYSIKGPWAPSFYEWTTNYGIVVDGTVKKTGSSSPYISTSYVQLLTWTGDITHGSDGTKSINVGVYLNQSNPSSYLPTQYTSSSPLSMGSVALTTIPRASKINSFSGTTIGGSFTVGYTSYHSGFTNKLRISIPNVKALETFNYTSGARFTLSKSSLDYIYSYTSSTDNVKIGVVIETWNGSTKIGESTELVNICYLPVDIAPTVGAITLTPQTYARLIQGKNTLKISVSGCSAGTGSSIKSYTFSGPGLSTTTTSTSATSGIISNTGTLTYTVTVTDNRGRTASGTKTITCYPYSAPYIKSFSVYRSDANGTKTDKGKCITCILNNSIVYSSVDSTNNVTVRLYYRNNAGVSGFDYETLMTNSTNIYVSKTISIGNGTYSAYLEITDRYDGKSITSTETIFGELRVLNITQDGTGIAFGKMSEKTDSNSNGLFECKWDAKFYGTATGPSGFSTSSDERVKKNIKDIDVNIVDGLRPVQYELSSVDDGKVHYGFVAQEVASLLDSVGLDSETTGMVGYIINNGQQEYVLTYTEFVPLLTKKCQDLQSEIDMLKQEIDELKNNIVK